MRVGEAELAERQEAGGRVLVVSGRLDVHAAASLWRQMLAAARRPGLCALDARGLSALDSAGAVLLIEAQRAAGGIALIPPELPSARAALERMARGLRAAPLPPPPPAVGPITRIGLFALGVLAAAARRITFLGEVTLAALALARRPWGLRRQELLRHLEEAGTRAFGLCVLLGTLLGIILAFQSSIPMRKFGAELFIPQLVGIALLRELGALMAAIILAGRSGSAFAAELGTMRVNEEIDALTTMGIDPLPWLILPRILAAMLVMPVLALVVNLTGLVGMGVVMGGLGVPAGLVIAQLQQWVEVKDLLGGLFKAAMFGLVIGIIGCRCGMRAGGGPRAVGDAATAAVVGSIVAVVMMDGLFALLFFRLGW
ncbi:MAG: ABC transporter permease [Rhodovarius sp.]|nr:ABC transporter permease [Rhodovarius sp.]MDW8313990.1 ABC transporter permease [Rhodovarius sp.]